MVGAGSKIPSSRTLGELALSDIVESILAGQNCADISLQQLRKVIGKARARGAETHNLDRHGGFGGVTMTFGQITTFDQVRDAMVTFFIPLPSGFSTKTPRSSSSS